MEDINELSTELATAPYYPSHDNLQRIGSDFSDVSHIYCV